MRHPTLAALALLLTVFSGCATGPTPVPGPGAPDLAAPATPDDEEMPIGLMSELALGAAEVSLPSSRLANPSLTVLEAAQLTTRRLARLVEPCPAATLRPSLLEPAVALELPRDCDIPGHGSLRGKLRASFAKPSEETLLVRFDLEGLFFRGHRFDGDLTALTDGGPFRLRAEHLVVVTASPRTPTRAPAAAEVASDLFDLLLSTP